MACSTGMRSSARCRPRWSCWSANAPTGWSRWAANARSASRPFTYLARRYADDMAVVWIDAHPNITLPGDAYAGFHAHGAHRLHGAGRRADRLRASRAHRPFAGAAGRRARLGASRDQGTPAAVRHPPPHARRRGRGQRSRPGVAAFVAVLRGSPCISIWTCSTLPRSSPRWAWFPAA